MMNLLSHSLTVGPCGLTMAGPDLASLGGYAPRFARNRSSLQRSLIRIARQVSLAVRQSESDLPLKRISKLNSPVHSPSIIHAKLLLVCIALIGSTLACGPYYLEKATLCDDLVTPNVEDKITALVEQLNPSATPLASPTPSPSFKTGVITFDLPQTCFESGGITGIRAGCWPPDPNGYFTVAPDGILDGQCGADEFRNDQLVIASHGILNGQYDAKNGIVTFHLVGTTTDYATVGDGKAYVTVTFDGTGNSTDSAVVTGTANFTYFCQTKGWGISCANGISLLETRGAVPFTIQFSP